LFVLVNCHRPAALIAANLNNEKDSFHSEGYKWIYAIDNEPFIDIMENNSRHLITVNPITLVINGDNQIQGVMRNGSMIRIDQHNSQFNNQKSVQVNKSNWGKILEQIPQGAKY